MLEILKLIRIRNIAFAAFVMYAMRYFVVFPLLARQGLFLQLTDGNFFLLVLSVCCLVSAAYVINDYFDTKADRISGSRGVIVGKTITRRRAIALHTVLNVAAVGISFYLAWLVRCWLLGAVFVAVSALLWFHASHYKKCFVWGNLLVAFLTALIPLTVILFELPLLRAHLPADVAGETSRVLWSVSAYSYFLFVNMLVYEISKDIFSVDGDKAEGTMTFPVKLGLSATKRIIDGLVAICWVSLWGVYFLFFYPDLCAACYFAAVSVYYACYLRLLHRGKTSRNGLLNHLRAIMFLLVCFSVLFFYLIQQQ